MDRPPLMMMGEDKDSFRYMTLTKRCPGMLRNVVSDNGAGMAEATKGRLLALAAELENDGGAAVPALDESEEYKVIKAYFGKPWRDTPWLHGECYLYHVVAHALSWDRSALSGSDYFLKSKEKSVAMCQEAMEAACVLLVGEVDVHGDKEEDRVAHLLKNALWGNRVDLCLFSDTDASRLDPVIDAHIISNDVQSLARHLLSEAPSDASEPKTVHLIADNSGYEIFCDLVLLRHLCLVLGYTCVLHCKDMPYFVSDVMPADVSRLASQLGSGFSDTAKHPACTAFGAQVAELISQSRIRLCPDPFWTAPLEFSDMPAGLRGTLSAAAVALVKGDLNYRKLVGDRHWPRDASFAEATDYFPCPVAALRTGKSEVCVGVAKETQERLEKEHPWPKWGVSGDFGVIQFRP
ncbi:Protein-glutamate O-methyltransferase SPCC1393.13 [Diplonema papillatum]|nr:Protein-glutamate O-methyltransferase SPCC1393.13 [Diplonema papillatum]